MQKLPKGTCSKECREQAVKWVLEEGLSLREAGQRLSLSPKTLQNGAIAARKGTLKAVGDGQPPLTALELEWAQLKRGLAELDHVRDMRWRIEQLHREGRQVTGLERCQCRTARMQRNHIGCAFLVWVRLQH